MRMGIKGLTAKVTRSNYKTMEKENVHLKVLEMYLKDGDVRALCLTDRGEIRDFNASLLEDVKESESINSIAAWQAVQTSI